MLHDDDDDAGKGKSSCSLLVARSINACVKEFVIVCVRVITLLKIFANMSKQDTRWCC